MSEERKGEGMTKVKARDRTYLILREIRKPLGIIMSSQNNPSRGSRIESINMIRKRNITNRCRVCECILSSAFPYLLELGWKLLSLRAILDS